MKPIHFLIVIILMMIFAAGCEKQETLNPAPATLNTAAPIGENVLPGAWDDGQGNVYIKADGTRLELLFEEDRAIANLLEKKRQWQNQFTGKKIVSQSLVNGAYDNNGPIVYGLLIHYEYTEPR